MWEVKKTLGIGHDGDEAEVVSRIAHLEESDEEIFQKAAELKRLDH